MRVYAFILCKKTQNTQKVVSSRQSHQINNLEMIWRKKSQSEKKISEQQH